MSCACYRLLSCASALLARRDQGVHRAHLTPVRRRHSEACAVCRTGFRRGRAEGPLEKRSRALQGAADPSPAQAQAQAQAPLLGRWSVSGWSHGRVCGAGCASECGAAVPGRGQVLARPQVCDAVFGACGPRAPQLPRLLDDHRNSDGSRHDSGPAQHSAPAQPTAQRSTAVAGALRLLAACVFGCTAMRVGDCRTSSSTASMCRHKLWRKMCAKSGATR